MPPPRPSILVISVDTLRADHLQSYGYERKTSPAIDRFASASTRFEQAHTHSTATLPAHLSLLTSRLPPQLGITRADGINDTQYATHLRLADSVETLAEVLAANGYTTAAFTEGGFVDPRYGFDQGFAHFETVAVADGATRDGLRQSLPRIGEWLEARENANDARPFFLFLHTYDIHEPYETTENFTRIFSDMTHAELERELGYPPRPRWLSKHREQLTEETVDRVKGLYDNGVYAVDRGLARLFVGLQQLEAYDDAILVLLSDHGEEFLDHGDFGHGGRVYQEQARVPLLFRLPRGRGAGNVVNAPVGLIDVAPTLLDFAQIEAPAAFEGRSLRGLIEGDDDGSRFETRDLYVGIADRRKNVAALRRGRWKLVDNGAEASAELYDLAADPTEQRDLADRQPARVETMQRELVDWTARLAAEAQAAGLAAVAQEPGPPDPEHEATLEALGYIR
jgi:arylsulfatase A-like enzyme